MPLLSKEELKREISAQLQAHLASSGEPLLLSDIGASVKSKFGDYRAAIEPLTLRQFIELEMNGEVTIVRHPHIPQKIGIAPPGSSISFGEISGRKRTRHLQLLPIIWRAFTEPLAEGKVRILQRTDWGWEVADVSEIDPEQASGAKTLSREHIVENFDGSRESVMSVFSNFESWRKLHGFSSEEFIQPLERLAGEAVKPFDGRGAEALHYVLSKMNSQNRQKLQFTAQEVLDIISDK